MVAPTKFYVLFFNMIIAKSALSLSSYHDLLFERKNSFIWLTHTPNCSGHQCATDIVRGRPLIQNLCVATDRTEHPGLTAAISYYKSRATPLPFRFPCRSLSIALSSAAQNRVHICKVMFDSSRYLPGRTMLMVAL